MLNPYQANEALSGIVEYSEDRDVKAIYGLGTALRAVALGAVREYESSDFFFTAVESDVVTVSNRFEIAGSRVKEALRMHREHIEETHLHRHPSARDHRDQLRSTHAALMLNHASELPIPMHDRNATLGARILLQGIACGISMPYRRPIYLESLNSTIVNAH